MLMQFLSPSAARNSMFAVRTTMRFLNAVLILVAICHRSACVAAHQHIASSATLLSLTGDSPWVVPPELATPSEARSDFANDTAQTLALRDVELDWYSIYVLY